MIKFYNSLTKKKEEFKPIEKKIVKIYSCGPTVYNYVHIGNLRAYVFSDILIKTLKYFKFEVISVMNITDVDDKTIRDSVLESEDGKNEMGDEIKWNGDEIESKDKKLIFEKNSNLIRILKNFTDKYKKYFLDDLSSMHIEKAKFMPSAVNSIKDMEFLIQKLFDKNFAYIGDDGIYFNLKKYKNYGHLVNINFSNQKKNINNRLINDEYDKENASDFVLWKFKKNNEPFWNIKINGKNYEGRPGWHIECSAMSYAYLGKKFDIHTGGIDLKFPHHENEIAQSSCALDIETQANYWMHNEHLLVNGKKMSKSLKNFYTLKDIKNMGFSPLALRELYLRSHYRQQLNFTLESLKSGEINVEKINSFNNKFLNIKTNNINEINEKIQKIFKLKLDKFESALKDDLNTPIALASLYEFMNEINKINSFSKKDVKLILEFINKLNSVLSLIKKDNIPENILKLANERKIARENKNWKKADEIRDKLLKLGYNIKDDKNSKSGFILSEEINK